MSFFEIKPTFPYSKKFPIRLKVTVESDAYYAAIWEIQAEIRNKLKWGSALDDATLEYVSGLICGELNERKLNHYWNPRDED